MRHLRVALGGVLLVAGCGGGGVSETDAGRMVDCNGVLDGGLLNLIVFEGALCATCDYSPGGAEFDYQCAEFADSLVEGCVAYCDSGFCMQRCNGDCAEGFETCEVGLGQCEPPYSAAGLWQCEPTCGSSGGCRNCVFDEECVRDFGDGASCQRHCHTCCGGSTGVDCSVCI